MELKDFGYILGVVFTVGGVVFGVAKAITNSATIKDLFDLERKILALIEDKAKHSLEHRASLVPRVEFTSYAATVTLRFDRLDAKIDKHFDGVSGQLDAVTKSLTSFAVEMAKLPRSKGA